MADRLREVAPDAWRNDLAANAERIAAAWGLVLGAPLPGSTQALLRTATDAAGRRLVLKLAQPGERVRAEADALRAWNGNGAVRLVSCDVARGALLLERIKPGTSLARLTEAGRDEEATRIAARLMRRLAISVPPDTQLTDLRSWGGALGRVRDRRLPEAVLGRARGLLRELLASAPAPVLLHGDLHHGNILEGAAGWTAIDPAGAYGDPLAEVGALLRNPIPWLAAQGDSRGIQERRIAVLAEELQSPRERIAAWGFVVASISAAWALEDGAERLGDWLAAVASLDGLV